MYRTSPAAFSTPDREFDASPAPSFGVHAVHPGERPVPSTARPGDDPSSRVSRHVRRRGRRGRVRRRGFLRRVWRFSNPGLPDFTPTRTEVTPGRYGDRGFRALGPLETPSPRSLAIRREEENAMATRIQAVGRGYLARVEYRARMDAARRTESAARRTEEVARRTEAAVRLEAGECRRGRGTHVQEHDRRDGDGGGKRGRR